MTRADMKTSSDLRKRENDMYQTQGQGVLDIPETIEDKLERWNRTSKKLGMNPIMLAIAEEDCLDKIDKSVPFDAEHLFIDCILDDFYTFAEQVRDKAEESAMRKRCML